MEQKQQLLRSIELLSEEEKLELFKVEELETRLEMAVATAGADTQNGNCNGSCNQVCGTVDAACW